MPDTGQFTQLIGRTKLETYQKSLCPGEIIHFRENTMTWFALVNFKSILGKIKSILGKISSKLKQ